jgi:hypothetical protein
LGSNNKEHINKLNGPGLDLWYNVRPYNAVNNIWTESAKNVGKHGVDGVIRTSIIKGDNNKTLSRFVTSKLNSNTDEEVNDTSLVSIISHLQRWRATYVDYADFAYLKHVGVYPTNRLMIARRFSGPVGNNLYKVDADPMATMISWVPDNTDFFSMTFGELWETGETSFFDVVTSMGKDWNIKEAGDFLKSKITPAPGVSENLQIKIAEKLGIKGDYDSNNPPLGNPNLVMQSMRRALIDKSRSGGDSGLKSSFSIKFTVEYEQKFINDVDPSLIYLDIIHKALIFGTSKSVFYFGGAADGTWKTFFESLYSGDVTKLIEQIWNLIKNITTSILELIESVRNNSLNLEDLAQNTIGQITSKYRVKLFSVMQALTGAPSGYFHVTVGNPIKPIFSSGDMIISEAVTLTLGKQLSYNDLPSSIKIEFTLIPTRSLGGQEIFDRLNTGTGRTYFQDLRSWVEIPLFGASSSEWFSGDRSSEATATAAGARIKADNTVEARYAKFKNDVDNIINNSNE